MASCSFAVRSSTCASTWDREARCASYISRNRTRLRRRPASSAPSKGFLTKSWAPASSARRQRSRSADPVVTMTGRNDSRRVSWSLARTWKPSRKGILTSSTMTAGRNVATCVVTRWGSVMPLTCTKPSLRRIRSRRAISAVSSSTIRMRSEEHTSELQSLMRISYAVFCLKKKKIQQLSLRYYSDKIVQRHNIHHNNTIPREITQEQNIKTTDKEEYTTTIRL